MLASAPQASSSTLPKIPETFLTNQNAPHGSKARTQKSGVILGTSVWGLFIGPRFLPRLSAALPLIGSFFLIQTHTFSLPCSDFLVIKKTFI